MEKTWKPTSKAPSYSAKVGLLLARITAEGAINGGIEHCLNWPNTTSGKAAFDLYLLTEQVQCLQIGVSLYRVCLDGVCCPFTEDFSFHRTASCKESVGVPCLPQ